jgi:hypothetical protein
VGAIACNFTKGDGNHHLVKLGVVDCVNKYGSTSERGLSAGRAIVHTSGYQWASRVKTYSRFLCWKIAVANSVSFYT